MQSIIDSVFCQCTNQGVIDRAMVDYAEDSLQIKFPKSYRFFISKYGASLGNGFEIFGIVKQSEEPPLWTDTVKQTLQDRQLCNIPVSYVALSHDGGEFGYYLDCSIVDSSGECPVAIWGPNETKNKAVSNSFIEFIQYANLP